MARGKASETEGKLFAQRLKEAMKGRGLKAATLSAKIKAEQDFTIQRQSISQYIDGQSNPDTERLTAICKALDVSADYLLGLEMPCPAAYLIETTEVYETATRRDAEELLARLGKAVFDPVRNRPEFVGAEGKIRRLLQ